jgi:hypothetical protein
MIANNDAKNNQNAAASKCAAPTLSRTSPVRLTTDSPAPVIDRIIPPTTMPTEPLYMIQFRAFLPMTLSLLPSRTWVLPLMSG